MGVGRVSEAIWSPKALAIYEELGDLGKQATVLSNMAALAFWQGDWSESLELNERGRDAFLRTGAQVEAAYGATNIGEILIYQGHLDEAEEVLRAGMRIVRASSARSLAAFINGLLGIVEARRGRFVESHTHLDAARMEYREIGEADHVREIEGIEAECLTLEGRVDEGAAIAQKLLDEGSAGPQVPMLHRVLAMASLTQGDAEGGRTALHASLEAARVRGADHDVAFTLDVLTTCLSDDDPELAAVRRERDALFERLGMLETAG